jgi:hypothetical protein
MGAAAAPGKAASASPACGESGPASRDFKALGAKTCPDFSRRRERAGAGSPATRRADGEMM